MRYLLLPIIFGVFLLGVMFVPSAFADPLVELDKSTYNWTDIVYITITASDHNLDSAVVETIGTSSLPIKISTHAGMMCPTGDKTYKAVETGPDTGVFTAQVELTGYSKAANSGTPTAGTSCGTGNTDGKINTDRQSAGISVSFEPIDGTVYVASSVIWWNIGEASFDSTVISNWDDIGTISVGDPATFTVVDPDENVDSAINDTFTVDVYSDSDQGGLTLGMTETGVDTGIFTGVFITTTDATSGSNLHVSNGDTVTAEYTDETLPEPYTSSDDLTISSTFTVGTVIPPLERAPAANVRVVDAFGSSVAEVSIGQQVQIQADVSNGQNGDQVFAYLVQMRDSDNVPVSLAWITGSLDVGESLSPALSWTPSDYGGTYTTTVFVWESVDNPIPLSPPASTTVDVVQDGSGISITQPSGGCGDGTVLVNGVCQIQDGLSDLVTVDADVYDYSNEITISGNFENYDGTSHIIIIVYAPNGNLVTVNQIVPDSSGSFSTDEIAAGMFSLSGTYTVKAYLGDNVLQTTFLFGGAPAAEPEVEEQAPEPTQTEVVDEEVDEEPIPVIPQANGCGSGTVWVDGVCELLPSSFQLTMSRLVLYEDAGNLHIHVAGDRPISSQQLPVTFRIEAPNGNILTIFQSNYIVGLTTYSITPELNRSTIASLNELEITVNAGSYSVTQDFTVAITPEYTPEEPPQSPVIQAVTTFLDDNPREDITQLPEGPIMDNYPRIYSAYLAAVYWQDYVVPFILEVANPTATLDVLRDKLEDECNYSHQFRDTISRYNSDGTDNEAYQIAELNQDFYCDLTNYPDRTLRYVNDGMSVQSAVNKIDEQEVQWIMDEYLYNSQEHPEEQPQEQGPIPDAAFTVSIKQGSTVPGCHVTNTCYDPTIVSIDLLDDVVWINNDNGAHTVTSGSPITGPTGVFDSELITPGAWYHRSFNQNGTYEYFCMLHPWTLGAVIVGGVPPSEPEPEVPSPVLNVSVAKNEYDLDEEISLSVSLANTESDATVIVDVLDSVGNPVVVRAVTVSPGSSESIQFRISDNFLTGNYKVVASANIDGNAVSGVTYFKIKSLYNQFQITSIQVTDQQGDPSTLTKGAIGYVKVTITSDMDINALITVNLFDANLTTLGVGSVRSTIGEGESEIILSFLIPNNAASGAAEIFANGFTDWISNGGIPLTGEFSTTEAIT